MPDIAKHGAGEGGEPVVALSSNSLWSVINFRSGLISALREAGYRVAVLAPPGEGADSVRALGADFHPIPMQAKGRSPLADLSTLGAYRRALGECGAGAYLGFTIKPNIWGSLAARGLGIPVIANVTGLGEMFARRGPIPAMVRSLYRAALAPAARIFFQNPDDRDLFVGGRRMRDGQVALLPGSGVDLDRFAPRASRVADGKTTFLFAGRLLWDKGVGEFVEAARTLADRDLEFRILGFVEPNSPAAVGQGDLDRWVAEGIVTYLGATSDVRDHLAAADCVVLPSYYREGVPRILLEASAMGVPVITADSPGCREAVEDGVTGLLCDPRSSDSLSAAMERFAALSASERSAMGLAGRARMERRFDERIVHRAYLEALLAVRPS